jgi:hypothetical protein
MQSNTPLTVPELKQRELQLQKDIAQLIRTGSSQEYRVKRDELDEVQNALYKRFNSVGEELTRGARS